MIDCHHNNLTHDGSETTTGPVGVGYQVPAESLKTAPSRSPLLNGEGVRLNRFVSSLAPAHYHGLGAFVNSRPWRNPARVPRFARYVKRDLTDFLTGFLTGFLVTLTDFLTGNLTRFLTGFSIPQF